MLKYNGQSFDVYFDGNNIQILGCGRERNVKQEADPLTNGAAIGSLVRSMYEEWNAEQVATRMASLTIKRSIEDAKTILGIK